MINRAKGFRARTIEESFVYLKGVIYGDFGSGKTFLAGTSVFQPDMRDILYLSLEGGEKGLKELIADCARQDIKLTNHVLVVPIETYEQYAQVFEFLKLHVAFRDAHDLVNLRKLEAQIRGISYETEEELTDKIPEPKMIKTVITDSLTEAQKYCMYQIMGIDPDTQGLSAEPEQPQFADWGRSREMIQFLVRRLRDLPVHSIFICAEDIEQDARKQFHYDLMLPGKLAKDVRGLVDFVGYLVKVPLDGGRIERRLYLEGGVHGGVYLAAKHRFGSRLEGVFVKDPTMVDLYKYNK